MDSLINEALSDFNTITAVTLIDLILSLVCSLVLSTVLARVYILTHSGHSYSRSFTIALILVSITIALIMVIIGSNIARAFALVGAMSIVRFRNPIKDSRDLVFVFMAIAIGMASGTQFYSFALIFTSLVCIMNLVFHYTGFGVIKSRNYVVRIRTPPQLREVIDRYCKQSSNTYFVVSLDRLAGDRGMEEIVYEMELSKKVTYEHFVQGVSELSPEISISLLVGENLVDA